MIEFNYTTQNEEIVITLKTNLTEIGTFHRMAAVIYSLGWDIISGDIRTIEENGVKYSFDMLRLRSDSQSNTKTNELGILMDSVFSKNMDLSELLNKNKIANLEPRKFFKEKAELVFEDDLKANATVFYIEAGSAKGLLFYLTKVLMEHKIDIISGVIHTNPITKMAEDTFYLLDQDGKLFGKTAKAEEIRKQILKPL